MSHIIKAGPVIRNLTALRMAAEHIGLEYQSAEIAGRDHFRGYQGARQHGATAIMRLSPESKNRLVEPNSDYAKYEIGVVPNKNGEYELKYDPWCEDQGLATVAGPKLQSLAQAYQLMVTKINAEEASYDVQIERAGDGTYYVTIDQENRESARV